MLLAIETSGMQGEIALADSGRILEERSLCTAGRRHAQTLVSEVQQLLEQHGLKSEDLSAIAVSVGPGSFTGLRVGIVFAATLSWLHKLPLVAVNTLEAMAQQIPSAETHAVLCSDAQRDEVFAAWVEWNYEQQLWRLQGDVQVRLPRQLAGQQLVAGTVVERHAETLLAAGHTAGTLQLQPKAATVAQVGQQLVLQGCFCAPEELEPLYIRASYAEEKRDAALQKHVEVDEVAKGG